MLNLSFNLIKEKKGCGYLVNLTADEDGRVLHKDYLKGFTGKAILSVRKKIITLDNKRLTLTLNVIGRPKEPKARRKKKIKQLKKSGK